MSKFEEVEKAQEQEVKEIKMTQLLIHQVPEKLKKKFKVSCVRKGRTMRNTIISFMKDHIKETKKENND